MKKLLLCVALGLGLSGCASEPDNIFCADSFPCPTMSGNGGNAGGGGVAGSSGGAGGGTTGGGGMGGVTSTSTTATTTTSTTSVTVTTSTGPGPVECDDGVCEDVLSGQCLGSYFCGSLGLCAGLPLPGESDDNACTHDVCNGNSWDHVPYAADEITDGVFCTTDVCEPGSGVSHTPIVGCTGACTNPTDDAVLMVGNVEAIAGDCAKKNLSDADKALDCIKEETGLTDDCAVCFHNKQQCIIQNCLSDCIADASQPACVACVAETCDEAFFECSGL